jgi:F420H(2)-dependent quinone reductase
MTHTSETYAPSPKIRERAQVELYEATNGEAGGTLFGAPVVIVTHRGAQTGLVRKTPLIRVERNGTYALIATNGGSDREPLWVRNIDAHPQVTVQDRDAVHTLTARRADHDEKQTWWKRAYSVLPRFADYQTATDRDIVIFLLEPTAT